MVAAATILHLTLVNDNSRLGVGLPRSHRLVSEAKILAYEFTPRGRDRH